MSHRFTNIIVDQVGDMFPGRRQEEGGPAAAPVEAAPAAGAPAPSSSDSESDFDL